MKRKGIKFTPIYSRQSYKVNGRVKFWGGLTAEVDGEGPALINSLTKIAKKQKIEVLLLVHIILFTYFIILLIK